MSLTTMFLHPKTPAIRANHNPRNSGELTIQCGDPVSPDCEDITIFTGNDAYSKAVADAINAVPHPADEINAETPDDTVGDAAPLPIVEYYDGPAF